MGQPVGLRERLSHVFTRLCIVNDAVRIIHSMQLPRHTSGMDGVTVRRVDFGYFVRPPDETGTGMLRVEPCLGYLVEHPAGTLLFDTGMGSHPDVEARYRPRRQPLAKARNCRGATGPDHPCSELSSALRPLRRQPSARRSAGVYAGNRTG